GGGERGGVARVPPRRIRRGDVCRGKPLRRDGAARVIRVADEVRDALAAGGAVVALETTLVAHGFPPGEGVAVGLESEARVRAAGAGPPPGGGLAGGGCAGMSAEEPAGFDASPRHARPTGPRAAAAPGA